jgi:Hsp20/alpha crystallin family
VRFALTNLHLSSDAEVSFDVELDRVLNSIGWYAKEYKLSPKQVKWVFEAGLIAGANSGKLTIPPSTLECHEILVFFRHREQHSHRPWRAQDREGRERGELRRVERQYGSFTRSFTLPSSADPGQVSAHYDNGVLKIKLAKKAVVGYFGLFAHESKRNAPTNDSKTARLVRPSEMSEISGTLKLLC